LTQQPTLVLFIFLTKDKQKDEHKTIFKTHYVSINYRSETLEEFMLI